VLVFVREGHKDAAERGYRKGREDGEGRENVEVERSGKGTRGGGDM
jgi:hypothetical protein